MAKSTRQRQAIAEALGRAPGFRSAQELYEELRAKGNRVGLTTVYRNLQALVDSEDVDSLRTADGEVIYRRCRKGDHHHHLVCKSCGSSVEIESDEVERWAADAAAEYGYTRVEHTAEVFGLCAACS